MLNSGAAEKIIRSMLKITDEKNAPIGFILSSFFLIIPVFVDTVTFLMMPLAKAMGMRLKKNYLLLALSVIAGAVMANSSVPPSLGPLYLVSAMPYMKRFVYWADDLKDADIDRENLNIAVERSN